MADKIKVRLGSREYEVAPPGLARYAAWLEKHETAIDRFKALKDAKAMSDAAAVRMMADGLEAIIDYGGDEMKADRKALDSELADLVAVGDEAAMTGIAAAIFNMAARREVFPMPATGAKGISPDTSGAGASANGAASTVAGPVG